MVFKVRQECEANLSFGGPNALLFCTFEERYPFSFLDSLHLYGTYEDWLMGSPKPAEMPKLLRRWEERAEALHSGWPVHSAIKASDYTEQGLLPQYVCAGFFRSHWTHEEKFSGSGLVIVWYQNESPVEEKLTLPKISLEDWQRLSKDFDY